MFRLLERNEREKEKKITGALPHLRHSHAPHQCKKDDAPLPTSSWMAALGIP